MKRVRDIRDSEVAPLWAVYFNGCTPEQKLELRNRLATHYYPLVTRIARRFVSRLPRSVEIDDLISAGSIGLLAAFEGFRPELGSPFVPYAERRIQGAIQDSLRSNDWVPRLARNRYRQYQKTLETLRFELGREPSREEIRDRLKMSTEEYESFLLDAQSNRLMLSLDDEKEKTTDNSDGGNRIIDGIEDQSAVDLSADAERLDYMSHLLSSLTDEERAVLVLYYFEDMTMEDIAKEAGLSESRICQIHGKALKYLLHKFSQYA